MTAYSCAIVLAIFLMDSGSQSKQLHTHDKTANITSLIQDSNGAFAEEDVMKSSDVVTDISEDGDVVTDISTDGEVVTDIIVNEDVVVERSADGDVMNISALPEDVVTDLGLDGDVMVELNNSWTIPPFGTEAPETSTKYAAPNPPLANLTCHGCYSTEMSSEKRLIKSLLQNYDAVGKSGRPVYNISQHIDVEFGLGLIQMDLDEKYKILKMSMWSKYKWRDEYLRWDPTLYNDVTKIRLSSELVWIPDIMLYNTADPDDQARDVLAVITYDGTVIWVPHQIFQSSCKIDVTNFPFDSQTCHMWFGSWTYTRQEVDVHMGFKGGIDLSTFQSDYKESSEWDITGTVAEKRIMPSVNETPSYAVLTFQIEMRRRLTFSSYILTLPCVFLACLTLVVFWLPPDRPDRTALAMSIFASFLVLLLILVEAAPPTASSVPVLGVYYCFCMVIIMLSVFLSSLVVNICGAGESRRTVPRWLRLLTLECLARFLLMHRASDDIGGGHREVDDDEDNGHYQLPPPGGGRGGRGGSTQREGNPSSPSSSSRTTHSSCSGLCCIRSNNGNTSRDTCTDCYEMTYCNSNQNRTQHRQHQHHDDQGEVTCSGGQLLGDSATTRPYYEPCSTSTSTNSTNNGDLRATFDDHVADMKRSLRHLQVNLVDRVHSASHSQQLCKQWRDVALVLDRLFFIMYIILIVVSLCVLFPRPKY